MKVYTFNVNTMEETYSEYTSLSLDVKSGETFGIQFWGVSPDGTRVSYYPTATEGGIQLDNQSYNPNDILYAPASLIYVLKAPSVFESKDVPLIISNLGRMVYKKVGNRWKNVWETFYSKVVINLRVRCDGSYEMSDKTVEANSSIKIGKTTLNETQLQSLLALLTPST